MKVEQNDALKVIVSNDFLYEEKIRTSRETLFFHVLSGSGELNSQELSQVIKILIEPFLNVQSTNFHYSFAKIINLANNQSEIVQLNAYGKLGKGIVPTKYARYLITGSLLINNGENKIDFYNPQPPAPAPTNESGDPQLLGVKRKQGLDSNQMGIYRLTGLSEDLLQAYEAGELSSELNDFGQNIRQEKLYTIQNSKKKTDRFEFAYMKGCFFNSQLAFIRPDRFEFGRYGDSLKKFDSRIKQKEIDL